MRREACVAGVLGMMLSVLAIRSPAFFDKGPLMSLLAREAPVLVVSAGMALVIVSRQIDISVGSQFAVCSVVGGLMLSAGWGPVAVVPVAVLLGMGMGAFQGALVAGLGLPSIVVTLAAMVTLREGLRWLQQGVFVNLPDGVQWFGLAQGVGQMALVGAALGVFLFVAWISVHTAAGRFVYATGSDADAARLAGIGPGRIRFATFVGMGALTGLASVLNVVQSPQVDPKTGSGLELKAIAAAVVGGIAVKGGRGPVWGVAGGLALLSCVGPALTHLHFEAYWEKAIQGGIILVAILAERLQGGWGWKEGRGR